MHCGSYKRQRVDRVKYFISALFCLFLFFVFFIPSQITTANELANHYCNRLMGNVLKATERRNKQYVLLITKVFGFPNKKIGAIICLGEALLGKTPDPENVAGIIYTHTERKGKGILRYKLFPVGVLEDKKGLTLLLTDFINNSGVDIIE